MADEPTPDMVPRAELERAVARERRKRREVQAALVVSVGLLLAACGAFVWWMEHKAAEQRILDARKEAEWATVTEGTEKHVETQLQLAADLRQQQRFAEAAKILDAIEPFTRIGPARLLPQIEQAKADLAFVRELDDIRAAGWTALLPPNGKPDKAATVARYRSAFVARGFDIAGGTTEEQVTRFGRSPVRAELLATLDDWAVHESDPVIRERLLDVARALER